MTIAMQRQTARALSDQLARVNALDHPIVERLREQLAERERTIEQLRERLRAYESNDADGRQWVTPSEFARLNGVSQSTISRALTHRSGNLISGNVQHLPGGRYLIERSATFTQKRKNRK